VRPREPSDVVERDRHDRGRFLAGELPLLGDELSHDAAFLIAHAQVGLGHAPEQVGEGGDVARAPVVEAVEHVADGVERLGLTSRAFTPIQASTSHPRPMTAL